MLSSLGWVVLQLSSGNCGKKIQAIQQQESLQLALLHLREMLLNFWKDYYKLLPASQVSTQRLRRFVLVRYLCMTGMKRKGRKEISLNHKMMEITGEKKTTLSCHLVHSLDSTEHEFSLTVRACSNIQDKLPSSLLHTIPHIYNHPTILNRFFPIYIGCLQWLSHFVTTLFVTCPSCTCLGLSISHKKTTFNLVKENSYLGEAKM